MKNYSYSLVIVLFFFIGIETVFADTTYFYVSLDGDDENDGTINNPFRTVLSAIKDNAHNLLRTGNAVTIILREGSYREEVQFGGWQWTAPLRVEAAAGEDVAIVGSDIFTDWIGQGGDVYTHTWENDWGLQANPWEAWSGTYPMGDVLKRRELVIVNGEILTPVLTYGEMISTLDSFYVDETADLLYVHGLNLGSQLVEVGLRELVLRVQNGHNISFHGISFKHSVWGIEDFYMGAVTVGGGGVTDNIVFEDCSFDKNNLRGFQIMSAYYIDLINCRAVDNGFAGVGTYLSGNLLFENLYVENSNWRGLLAGFQGWAAGEKYTGMRNVTFINYTAINNHARGFWPDISAKNVTFDGCLIKNNAKDGMMLEVVQGPIYIKNCIFENNENYGILGSHAENIIITDSMFINNGAGSITFPNNFRTEFDKVDQVSITLRNQDWTLHRNHFIGAGELLNVPSWTTTETWNNFLDTLTSDYNEYCSLEDDCLFSYDKIPVTLDEWKNQTLHDLNSVNCTGTIISSSSDSSMVYVSAGKNLIPIRIMISYSSVALLLFIFSVLLL